jgi:hypothetical protein
MVTSVIRSFFVYAVVQSLYLFPTFATAQRLNIVQYAPDDTWLHYSSMINTIKNGNGNELNLDDTSQLSDGHLISIAYEAYQEMEEKHEEGEFGDQPRAMAALQVKNQIFLSSSLKHNEDGFMAQFPNSRASIALERCSAASAQDQWDVNAQHTGDTHRTNGNCGEPAAVHLFYREHPDEPEGALPEPARMVAVTRGNGGMRIMNPCEAPNAQYPNTWGCSRFMTDLRIRAIWAGTAEVAIPGDWGFYWGTTCL